MYAMNTTTINITLPVRLKEEIENRVQGGMYASVSEFIRHSVRRVLAASAEEIPYSPPFSAKAVKEILAAEKAALKNRNKNIVLNNPEEIDRFFSSL